MAKYVVVRASEIAAHPTHRMDSEYWIEKVRKPRDLTPEDEEIIRTLVDPTGFPDEPDGPS